MPVSAKKQKLLPHNSARKVPNSVNAVRVRWRQSPNEEPGRFLALLHANAALVLGDTTFIDVISATDRKDRGRHY